jgi:hypothetical protein
MRKTFRKMYGDPDFRPADVIDPFADSGDGQHTAAVKHF